MSSQDTVLIIDDDPDYVSAISALLEGAGCRVRTARSGSEGLARACADPPALILLDVIMAERTEGFFVLQELRRVPALADIPVIVLSSIYNECPEFRVRPDAGWMPATLFLAKPVPPAQLLDEVQGLLARRPTGARPET